MEIRVLVWAVATMMSIEAGKEAAGLEKEVVGLEGKNYLISISFMAMWLLDYLFNPIWSSKG